MIPLCWGFLKLFAEIVKIKNFVRIFTEKNSHKPINIVIPSDNDLIERFQKSPLEQ